MKFVKYTRSVTLVAMFLVALLVVTGTTLHLTGQLALKETLVNGTPISDDEAASLGLRPGESLLLQDCELVAQVMCRRSGIGSAEVELDFPDRIVIHANNSRIAFVAHDDRSNEIMGITPDLRVVEYDEELADPDTPLLLGLGALELYQKPADSRITSVVDALTGLGKESKNWLSEFSAIDFSSPEFVTVSLNSYNFPVICQPSTMKHDLESFFRLGASGGWPVDAIELIDLRYDDVLVVRGSATALGVQDKGETVRGTVQ